MRQDSASRSLVNILALSTRILCPGAKKFPTEDWPATVQSIAGTVVIAVFVVTFLVQAFTIPSESMEQTLLIGDYLLVDKFCYGGGGVGTVCCLTAISGAATSSSSIIP